MFGRLTAICSRPALSVGDAKIATETTTLTHADLPIHQPAPVEYWLAAHPHVGRHRGTPDAGSRPSTYRPAHALQAAPSTAG